MSWGNSFLGWGPVWSNAPNTVGMNLNHWTDEAWADGSWMPSSWGSGPTPTIVIDTHDGADRHYRKRTEQQAQIRALIEAAINGPEKRLTPVLAEVRKAVEPFVNRSQIDMAEIKAEVMAHIAEIHARHAADIEADDEEVLLMVLH